MDKKLVVLSFDSLQSGDLDGLKKMPYFASFWEEAAVVRNVREIYPTLTYPIHTTLVTGVRPNRHGIFHNQQPSIQPEEPDWSIMGTDWYWEKKHIRADTLVDAVLDGGRTAATVMWPVTAGEKRGWNVPEIWPRKGHSEEARALYERQSSANVMEAYYGKYLSRYCWNDNDDMMSYSVEIALDLLRRQQPDLLLCHVAHLDHIRHVYGVQGREVEDCKRQLDIIAGRFLQAARDAGTLEHTNFVILGDHGQIDVDTVLNLNVLFAQQGLIRTDGSGSAADYDAYSFSAGFSTQIMLKEPEDAKLLRRVHALLLQAQRDYPHLVDAVYAKEEAAQQEGLAGEFSFVVEGAEGVLFRNELDVPLIQPAAAHGGELLRGMHGHHPSKGEKPPFLAFGPDIRPGVRINGCDMLDIPATLAKLAGVEMPQMEGAPLPIFQDDEDASLPVFSRAVRV